MLIKIVFCYNNEIIHKFIAYNVDESLPFRPNFLHFLVHKVMDDTHKKKKDILTHFAIFTKIEGVYKPIYIL